MELYIKNMICNRCIMVVQNELVKLGLHPLDVKMGVVRLEEGDLDDIRHSEVDHKMKEFGFELLDNSRTKLIDQIKNLIIEKIHRPERLDKKVMFRPILKYF